MRNRLLAPIGAILFVVLGPFMGYAQDDYTRVKLTAPYTTKDGVIYPAGTQVCKSAKTGAIFKPPYSSATDVTKACNVEKALISWLGTAEAQTIALSFQTGTNADGTHDTTYPNGDKPPTGSVSWNAATLASLMAIVTSQTTGTATDINVTSACSGTNCGSATYRLHAAVTNWTMTVGGHVQHAGIATGNSPPALVLDVCYPNTNTCSVSGSFNWAYSAPAAPGSTPPNEVTGINGSVGTGTVTVNFDATTDPDDAVQTYRIRRNGAIVDTLPAPTPGLALHFTGAAIGSTTGSASQSAAPNAGQWSVTNNGGTGGGLENGQDTSIYAISAPVSGAALCARGYPTSITTAATYGKADVRFGNSSSSGTGAEINAVVLKQGGLFYLQFNARTEDGGTLNSSGSIALTGLPRVAVCPVGNTTTIKFSYDGGAWTNGFTNIAIALNDAKFIGCGAAGTNDGISGVSTTVAFAYCDVVSSTQLSKTVTTALGGTFTVSVIDGTPNERAAVGSVDLTPAGGGGGPSLKWNPGYYVRTHSSGLSCGTACDAQRHSLYSQIFAVADANIIGTTIWIDWKYLESDAGNNFAAGFLWLHNEINYFKLTYPGKKIGLLLNFSRYGPSDLSQAGSYFPAYLASANCLYMENSSGTGGGSDSMDFYKTNSVCLGYFNRLIAAYGAEFDSEPALAFVRIQQETDDAAANVGISGAAEDAAWKNVALASRNAFPTTPIWIPINWTGVNTAASIEALLLYYKSIGVGMGNGDTQPINLAYPCPSTAWACVVKGLNASIGGSSHDNCGEFLSMGSVELSEMGYNSVRDPFGGLTSQQVADSWNADTCQQYSEWEPNFNEIGTPATMYWNGAMGQKWAIDNIPVSHTTKPAGYP
jgi:hypothetical protein